MATISKIRGKFWGIRFRVNGRQFGVYSLGTTDEQLAMDAKLAVEHRVFQVEHNLVTLPPTVDVGKYCLRGEIATPLEKSLLVLVDEYLEWRTLRFQAGQLSYGSLASDESRLKNFKDWIVDNGHMNDGISTSLLREYQTYIFKCLSKDEIGGYDAFHKLRTTKAFVTWLYDEEIIDVLPRILKRYSEVKLPEPKPSFFTISQIHQMLEGSTDFQQLVVLLGLNCGYTSADISSLTHEMIDWERGIISRNRSKTTIKQRHKLWKPTLDLLLKLKTNAGEMLLLRPDGKPLKISGTHRCYVKNQFWAILNRMQNEKKDISGMTHKMCRKTSANLIAEHYVDYPHVVDMFLAHGERGKKTAHYVEKHYRLLDEATEWLFTKLDLVKVYGE